MNCYLTEVIYLTKAGLWLVVILSIYGLIELGNRLKKLNSKSKESKGEKRMKCIYCKKKIGLYPIGCIVEELDGTFVGYAHQKCFNKSKENKK